MNIFKSERIFLTARCRDFLKEGKIEVHILHSNAVENMDFAAVAEVKKRMAEHGDEII